MAQDQELPEISPEMIEQEELQEIDPSLLDEEQSESTAPEDEPISLVDDVESDGRGNSKIQTFGAGRDTAEEMDFKRAVNVTGMGATRCKIFHSKIAPGSLEFLEKQIDEWLDSEEIEVKFVNQCVGVLEGKRAEPNLLITVWY